jgi:tetratricopeptide (TPR) repeat protein
MKRTRTWHSSLFAAGGLAVTLGVFPSASVSVTTRAADVDRDVYDLLQGGRYREAERILRDASASLPSTTASTELYVRLLLERRSWSDLLTRVHGSSGHAMTYAVGLAASQAVRLDGPASLETARAMHDALEADARRAGRRSIVELERLSVQAAIAAAQEEREEMALVLLHAIDLENELGQGVKPLLAIPVRELAGDLWLEVDRERDARREYLAALSRFPGRARSVLGLARASEALGDVATARDAYRTFLAWWARADADRPELREAASYIGFIGR